jgi:gliding motility-associated-like protein
MNLIKRHCLALTFLLAAFTLRAGTIFPVDTIHAHTYTCTTMDVCIPIPAGNIADYQIFQDGMPYAAGVVGCDFDTTITYTYNTLLGLGNMGPYHLDTWSVNGQIHSGTFMNIPELVGLMNSWDPQGNWIHEPSTLSIKGGKSGNAYSGMQVTVLANQTPSAIGLNFGLLPQGSALKFSEGTHVLIAQNTLNNQKDTVTVIVTCLQLPPPSTFRDTIAADGLPYTLCLNDLDFPGIADTIYNACASESGTYVHFYLDPANYCVKYQGLKCHGEEKACIVVCDNEGLCDTTFVVVYVDNSACETNSRKITDTLLVNFSNTYCIDTTILPGAITSIEYLYPEESGESVDFEYDEAIHCVVYTGFEPGLDRACYLLTDEFGNTDTTYLCVLVRLPQVGIILDTILLGQNETYCIDTTELAGNVVSIENFCPVSSGDEVNFVIDDVTLCLEARSLAIGTDTACIRVCDSYGVCDTTHIIITVFPDNGGPCDNFLPPVAVDDSASTQLNTPVNIVILANDTLGECPLTTVTLLDKNSGGVGPNHGLAVLNINQTVNYIPNENYCGSDVFQYVLCSPVGCDTATVFVDVACTEVKDTIIIYNGFSPNGDNINEYFKIENIEKHPDSDVKVYNRWGNLVFEKKGYKNDWDGKFNNRDLPTGTYFYRLEIDGGRRSYSGYLQLHR